MPITRPFTEIEQINLHRRTDDSHLTRMAFSELRAGLYQLGYQRPIVDNEKSSPPTLTIELIAGNGTGQTYTISYQINTHTLTLKADSPQALLYAVFGFLEHQGVFFGLDGAIYPPNPSQQLILPDEQSPWHGDPVFPVRGLQPWPDFLNCITIFNEEDLRAYLEAMMRMRFNTLGVHVYGQSNKWVEPFLSVEYGGVGHAAYADTTASDRWGYLPQRTSRYGMSAAQYFDGEVFGADATRFAHNPWEAAERSQAMWSKAFAYATNLGIRTGIGFEIHQLPEEIVRACPPEVRQRFNFGDPQPDGSYLISFDRVDPKSRAAKYILEARLANLLETYPTVRYVQLWEDEFTNWMSQRTQVETPVEPFMQAYAFLQRHAPDKQLVIAGWGGVVRNFERFHRELPEDIVFAALSDQFGWDPIHPVFGKLGKRERWPIPWLEDDPSMWFPQIHVSRFEVDLQRAQDYGCTGMMGIHWRHRIVDPVAGYMARRSWNPTWTTQQHYQAYAATQTSDPTGRQDLGNWFMDVDQNRRLLATWTGQIREDGHAETQEFSGDYNEVFMVEKDYDISDDFIRQQREALDTLCDLLNQTETGTLEHERLHYWYGQAGFLDPYARAWQAGRAVHKTLAPLFEGREKGEVIDTQIVYDKAIPLWLDVLRHMREAVLLFQHTVATRNDLGMLASLHNKFVRIGAFRLQAAILEFIDTLPEQVEKALAEALAPDTELMATVIVPTRPTRLNAGGRLKLTAIVPGMAEPTRIKLAWREIGTPHWQQIDMHHIGRRTYGAILTMPVTAKDGLEYRVRAEFASGLAPMNCTAPVEGAYIIAR